jgi:methionyl-tRNA formyltransferase
MKILFMGRKSSGATALWWTLHQKNVSVVAVLTDSQSNNSPCTEIATKWKIPILQLEDVYEKIQHNNIEFDLAVSFVYWRKLKEPLISFPKFGVINFHPAPLPEYRGTAGYNLAILDELDQWGVSAHYVDKNFDTGNIIDVFYFSIYHKLETAVTLESKSQEFLLALYKKTVLHVLQSGRLPSRNQNLDSGRYITRDQMEEMKRVLPNDDIDKKIRAFWFPPYTGAFVEINGEKYTLINNELLQSLNTSKINEETNMLKWDR